MYFDFSIPLLTLVRNAINLSNMSSLSVEQSKLTQQSTMKLSRAAICVKVSSINSFVSAGTGASALRGFGVDGVGTSRGVLGTGSSLPDAPSGFAALLGAGDAGRDSDVARTKLIGKGDGLGGVSRSIKYERKSSSWSLS